MSNTKKLRNIRIVFWTLSALWLVFIWANSMQSGDTSSGISSPFAKKLLALLGLGEESLPSVHHFVRKAAHFSEYFILSTLLCFSFYFTFYKKKETEYGGFKEHSLYMPMLALPCSVLAAFIDEGIQLFSVDRCGSLADVLLDSSGALLAMCIFISVSAIKMKASCKQKKRKTAIR